MDQKPTVNLGEDDRVLLEAALADQVTEMEKAHAGRVRATGIAVAALGIAHLVAAIMARDTIVALEVLLSFLIVSGTAFWFLHFLRKSMDERRKEFEALIEGGSETKTSHPAI